MMSASESSAEAPLSVKDLTTLVRNLLEAGLPSLWVAGEVSNVARPSSGHIYFTLKDASAQLRSVMYRGVALRQKFDLRDGMEVLARGRVVVYVPRGEYQFQIEELQPKGIGALDLAFRQLKEKLSERGWFRPERKRALPRFPACIALVTSATGAAVRDLLEILGRRWPAAEVIVRPTRVQGEGAAEDVAKALDTLNFLQRRRRLSIDVIVLGRGGGSLEDLWAFNEEVVAEAIVRSSIPVVSAVGHETDVTIADLVADLRAPTPSHAANSVVPDQQEIAAGLGEMSRRLRDAVRRETDSRRERLQRITEHRAFRLPLERIRDQEHRLDEIGERLRRALDRQHRRAAERVSAIAERLQALSPLNVLARGYTLTRTETGTLIRRTTEVVPGQLLSTVVSDGVIFSRVESQAARPQEPGEADP